MSVQTKEVERGRDNKLACPKQVLYHEQNTATFYWLHFPRSTSEDNSIGEDGSGEHHSLRDAAPDGKLCNLSAFAQLRGPPRLYAPGRSGSFQTTRIFAFGRLVITEERPFTTKIAFPGRILHIRSSQAEDAGVWVCCNTEKTEPLAAFELNVADDSPSSSIDRRRTGRN